jgi:tetratricopeptide (TPR) repeat protein
MNKTISITILLWATLALSVPEVTAQETSQSFAAGSTAFGEGDYLRALAHFQAARDAGMSGPAVHYNIGVSHYKLGNYREAEAAFRRVATDYPAMRALAQYNLGLALRKQGRESEAQSFFRQARQNSTDETLSRLADAMLTAGEPVVTRRPPTWVSLVDVKLGHDDNVALRDEASLPAGQSVDSAFTELVAVVTGPVSASRFHVDASAYSVRYGDAGEFDQNALHLRGAYRRTGDRWSMEAGPHFAYSTLDGDGFEKRFGVGLGVKRDLSTNLSVGIRVVHDEIDDGDARFAFVEGSRELLGVTLDRRGESYRLTFGYDLESNDREDPSVSPDRDRLWMRYRHAMNAHWATDIQVSYRSSAYDELEVTRDEDLTDLSLGLVRNLARRWQISMNYRWSENDSNVDAFSYTRNRFGLGLTRTF